MNDPGTQTLKQRNGKVENDHHSSLVTPRNGKGVGHEEAQNTGLLQARLGYTRKHAEEGRKRWGQKKRKANNTDIIALINMKKSNNITGMANKTRTPIVVAARERNMQATTHTCIVIRCVRRAPGTCI